MKKRIFGLILIILLLPLAIVSLTMDEESRINMIRDLYYLPNRVLFYNGINAAKRCIHYLYEGNLTEIGKSFVKVEDLDLKIRNRFMGIDIVKDKAYLENIIKRLRENNIKTLKVMSVVNKKIDKIDLLMVEFVLKNDDNTSFKIMVCMIKQSGKWLVESFGFHGNPPKYVIDLKDLDSMNFFEINEKRREVDGNVKCLIIGRNDLNPD